MRTREPSPSSSRRGAPVVEHAPEDRVGQRHEPAKTSVARLCPTADDEGPQDEQVDVGSSHECLPRPRGPDAVERLAAGEPILLLQLSPCPNVMDINGAPGAGAKMAHRILALGAWTTVA